MRVSPTATELLAAWRGGDERARDTLIEAVYAELHRLAEIYLRRERHNHTLQPTALINEAYLKLIDQATEIHFENRAHFVNVAALLMRRILVDYARARKSDKRGGSRQIRLSITSADKFVKESEVDLIDLDEALKKKKFPVFFRKLVKKNGDAGSFVRFDFALGNCIFGVLGRKKSERKTASGFSPSYVSQR